MNETGRSAPVLAPKAKLLALGMMSGTSCDGVDAAIIETDGERVTLIGGSYYRPYSDTERSVLRAALEAAAAGPCRRPLSPALAEADALVTRAHIEAVEALLKDCSATSDVIDVIGFHGQTVLHAPEQGRTVQIGDPQALAAATGIDVVYDFRAADVQAGGQGAPFASLYHAARIADDVPIAVVNVGGVSNLTFIAPGAAPIAFDCGPGNAPIDDWVQRHTGKPYDAGGALAAAGKADEGRIAAALGHPYFAKSPPKSLDRQAFTLAIADGLSPEDGAATLAAFTAAAIAQSLTHLPALPSRILVTGGGRHNPVVMRELRARIGAPVDQVEAVGWRGDSLEAEAFAFLAVRHLKGLPLSLPTTTGVPRPMRGGRLARIRGVAAN